jgi:hypothetical protein
MTTFCGHRTGFNATGRCAPVVPNEFGPPKTKFGGRGSMPEGPLKHFPGAVADISTGNRRLAKSKRGEGGGSGTVFRGRTGFSK